MTLFRIFVLWLHLGAVIVWIGGLFFLPVVLWPGLRASTGGERLPLVVAMGRRFLGVSREVIGLVVLTGIFNLITRGWLIDFNFSGTYLRLFTLKVLLVAAVALSQVWHATTLMPRLQAFAAASGEASVGYLRLRRLIVLSAAGTLVTAAFIVFLGLYLRLV